MGIKTDTEQIKTKGKAKRKPTSKPKMETKQGYHKRKPQMDTTKGNQQGNMGYKGDTSDTVAR